MEGYHKLSFLTYLKLIFLVLFCLIIVNFLFYVFTSKSLLNHFVNTSKPNNFYNFYKDGLTAEVFHKYLLFSASSFLIYGYIASIIKQFIIENLSVLSPYSNFSIYFFGLRIPILTTKEKFNDLTCFNYRFIITKDNLTGKMSYQLNQCSIILENLFFGALSEELLTKLVLWFYREYFALKCYNESLKKINEEQFITVFRGYHGCLEFIQSIVRIWDQNEIRPVTKFYVLFIVCIRIFLTYVHILWGKLHLSENFYVRSFLPLFLHYFWNAYVANVIGLYIRAKEITTNPNLFEILNTVFFE